MYKTNNVRLIPKGHSGWLADKLNAAGKVWKKFTDLLDKTYTTTAYDEYGHPIIRADGNMATRTSTAKKDITAAATGILLPTSAVTVGIPTTVGSTVLGGITGSIGSKVTKNAVKFAGGDTNAQNMGSDIGGFVFSLPGATKGFKVTNHAIRYSPKIRKRAAEAVLRLGDFASKTPINFINKIIKKPKDSKDLLRWIWDGTPTPKYNKSFSILFGPYMGPYTGIKTHTNHKYAPVAGNDYIDAFIYGKTVDPKHCIRKINPEDIEGEGKTALGGLKSYIDKYYKDRNILYYEMVDDRVPKTSVKIVPTRNTSDTGYLFGQRGNKTSYVDANGHLIQFGIGDDGKEYMKRVDIWKYLPEDYIKRNLHGKAKNFYYPFLKWLDDSGDPIYTQTPWICLDD